jgi:hypothetical protein
MTNWIEENWMKLIIICLFLFCGLAACTTIPDVPPTASFTLSPHPTSTPTQKPTSTNTSTYTPEPTFDPIVSSIDSPNGKFSAQLRINWDNPNEKPVIELIDDTGKVLSKVGYQYSWDPNVEPNDNLVIYGWSPDSSRLYFYYSYAYDGWYTLFNGSNLQSLDVSTGEEKVVIPGPCIAFAFSSDMTEIAYTTCSKVGIIDLTNDSNKSVDILPNGFEQSGWVFISPSGNKVIYHTLMGDDGTAKAIYLNPRTMKQKIFLDNYFIEDLSFDGWTPDENPRYRQLGENINIIEIDLNTLSKTVIGTPTPWP